jgi:hypothetical protein
MDVGSHNVSPMVWGFLFLAIKYVTSKEARSAFVEVVSSVHIKFDGLRISSTFH